MFSNLADWLSYCETIHPVGIDMGADNPTLSTTVTMADPSVFRAVDMAALVGGFRDALRANQSAVNRLNVYPVPENTSV